ncbi:reverse transcriptase domain-containing protein [Tanacetum coccineum]
MENLKTSSHGLTYHLRKKFLSGSKHYIWDDPYLFKSCPDGIIRRCMFGKELHAILEHCHMRPPGGHYEADITARKIFKSGFYWLTIFKDAARIRGPKALISDRETHFCNSFLEKALNEYGVTYRLAILYHPQTRGQTENTNRATNGIFKRTVNGNRKEWANKLDDALWAFMTAYKSPIGSTPFRIVYGKACHLPIEMEHKAYWALKNVNLDLDTAEKHRLKIFPGKLKTRWYGPYTINKVFTYETVEVRGSLSKELEFKVSPARCHVVNRYVLWKPSRDFTRPIGPPSGLKGLLHMLNATVIPTKGKRGCSIDSLQEFNYHSK